MQVDDSKQFAGHLRPSQEVILKYTGGKMGISAVPGSGKTWTLSRLAAQIIQSGILADDQEVLVVTLVNSSVDNFYQRVGSFVRQFQLIPNLGYRVRTLHGLAHDIVRQRPELAGLDNNFQILDERLAGGILSEAANAWLVEHQGMIQDYLDTSLDEYKLGEVKWKNVPELVKEIGLSVTRLAKDRQLTPEMLRQRLDKLRWQQEPAQSLPLPLAEMGWEIYSTYQRALTYRGAVDFDDLIRLALGVIKADPEYLRRLRYQWPYILEDEAQDSSRLQEAILRTLAGANGNWVRVGDPNQAIYETFTTANPRYLIDFLAEPDVIAQELPESGRSSQDIIDLANYLVRWTMESHPLQEARSALYAPPYIMPTAADDPQANPANVENGIRLVWKEFTPGEELIAVADSLARWLPDHAEQTVVVLTPINQRGFELVDELQRRKIPVEDGLLRSSSETRTSAKLLGDLLSSLADPQSARKLAAAYLVWRREDRLDDELALDVTIQAQMGKVAELIRKLRRVENYLWPAQGDEWLEYLVDGGLEPELHASLVEFRQVMRRWQSVVILPVDQLVLTIAQELLSDPLELALSHKLALLLRGLSQENTGWRLEELTKELIIISKNERRFLGFSQEDSGFDPEKYKGVVVVSTAHKAKGLEWDRVYLLSANNYDFPSGLDGDQYLSEKWFLRDKLNLAAEALSQFEAVLSTDIYNWYEEGQATQEARLDYVRERLRLFYVAITRAKRELVITWNTGKRGDKVRSQSFVALYNYLEGEQ